MNLDNLKPAWQKSKMLNSMQATDREEILLILDKAEAVAFGKSNGYLMAIIMFAVFTFCFQGG